MIVPMKKVVLIIKDEHTKFLEELRDTGVIHLKTKRIFSESMGELMQKKARIATARGILRKYPVKKDTPVPTTPVPDVPVMAVHILELAQEMDVLRNEAAELARERLRIQPWGDFDPLSFGFLEENGIKLVPYEIPLKTFETLGPDIQVLLLSGDKLKVRVLAVNSEIPNFLPFKFKDLSLSGINNQMEFIRKRIEEIEDTLKSLAYDNEILEAESNHLTREIEFARAKEGIETMEDVPEDMAVSWVSGFIPEEKIDILQSAATKYGWVVMLEDPVLVDQPPTQIKPNKVSKIAQPLFSLLGIVPGYWEKDVSISFMLFFCIFTAMLFGDAAYGLLILAIAFVVGTLMKKKNGVFPDGVKLIMLMAVFTIGWGTITGAWFAIPVENLPDFMRALIVPPFNKTGPVAEFPQFLQTIFNLPAEVPMDEFKTQWNIRFLCFTVAAIQLVWARVVNMKELLPSLSAIAHAGWLLMMLGIYFLVLYMLLGIALPPFAVYFIGIGLGVYFIFAEQNGGNFFINIAKSFGNFISILLKSISSFADIISYIRLFAVGLTGGMIAQTFNSMAIPAGGFGSFGVGFIVKLLAAILILVFGHALNMAMNTLSLVVHGARLNLLEYTSNHLGMGWSGYLYNPFANRQKK